MSSVVKNLFKAYLAYKTIQIAGDAINVFNGLQTPGGNLGISRAQMPQIDSNHLGEFEGYLRTHGVSLKPETVPVNTLMLCQNEYNKMKVLKLMEKFRVGGTLTPTIVSSDGFVLDGSHRFLALYNLNPNGNIKVVRASVKIHKLLEIARNFPGATFRTVSDSHLRK